jgi:adenylate kinase family enzyme
MIRRIHIIGGSGSGKSYIAQKLSSQIDIETYDLDNIFWDNSFDTFGKKANPEVRDFKLGEIISRDAWIIEGVYYAWLQRSFEKADAIFILKPSIYLQHKRVILRFLKRKIGVIKSKKKETIIGLFNLIKWNHKYNKFDIPKIIDLLYDFKGKIIIVEDNEEILKYVLKNIQPN